MNHRSMFDANLLKRGRWLLGNFHARFVSAIFGFFGRVAPEQGVGAVVRTWYHMHYVDLGI